MYLLRFRKTGGFAAGSVVLSSRVRVRGLVSDLEGIFERGSGFGLGLDRVDLDPLDQSWIARVESPTDPPEDRQSRDPTYEVFEIERVFEGRVARLAKYHTRFEDGRTIPFEVLEHPGAVAIVPLLPDGRVLLVRQPRIPAGGSIYEIPAGLLEPGDDPVQRAITELREETKYRPTLIQKVTQFFTSPGISQEVIHLFLARGLVWDPLPEGEEERIRVEPVDLKTALEWSWNGKIRDAKTITGLLMADQILARERGGNPGVQQIATSALAVSLLTSPHLGSEFSWVSGVLSWVSRRFVAPFARGLRPGREGSAATNGILVEIESVDRGINDMRERARRRGR